MYGNVDSWKWFENKSLSSFLTNFRPIFFSLKNIGTKVKEEKTFEIFWDKCKAYLKKLGYERVEFMMEDDSQFRKSSFSYWNKMYDKQPDGLEFMFRAFKACFGIVGNEDRCVIKYGDTINYSWQKMADCVIPLDNIREEYIIEDKDPKEYEWSEESKKLLQEIKEKLK